MASEDHSFYFFFFFFTGKERRKEIVFYFLTPSDLEEFKSLCYFVDKLTCETAEF